MINSSQIISKIIYAARWMSRFLLALVIGPATGFFMLAMFAGSWSFDGLARQFYEQAADLRVLNTNPPTFSVQVCADPKPDAKSPIPSVCSQWTQQTQGIDELASNTGNALRFLYVCFVFLGVMVMLSLGILVPSQSRGTSFSHIEQINSVRKEEKNQN